MPSRLSRRDQTFLLPVSMDEWIAPDHPARFVWEYVQALDLEELGIRAVPHDLGSPSYPSRELLACWLYGFMVRTRTSRALERACRESLPFMWVSGLLRPDHVTFWRFYDANRETMRGLFRSTVRMAVSVGMVDFALQSIDGTKIPVGSSTRLRRKKHLEELLVAVEQEIAEMEAQEHREGPPDGPQGRKQAKRCREDLRTRVRQALAQVQAAEEDPKRDSSKPAPAVLVSDPEARLMRTRHGWKPAYNAQALVDGKGKLIVAADVTQDNYDCDQLMPLLEQEQQALGRCAQVTVADNGYYATRNLERAQAYTDLYVPDKTFDTKLAKAPDYHFSKFVYQQEEDLYVCPQGKPLRFLRQIKGRPGLAREYQCRACAGCPVRGQCTKSKVGRVLTRTADLALQDAHRQKMATEQARDKMRQRSHLAEPVFGIIKEQQGATRFLTRGLAKVRQEWYLFCAAFNLRKLYRNWALTVAVTA